jgi:hypothetical protein
MCRTIVKTYKASISVCVNTLSVWRWARTQRTLLHVIRMIYASTDGVLITLSSFRHESAVQPRSEISIAEGVFPT